MVRLYEALFVACALAVALPVGLAPAAKAQELPVPCYAFDQDMLGNWIATEELSMYTPLGLLEIMPGHPVSVVVANILNARCG
jgi:hypothetical protein